MENTTPRQKDTEFLPPLGNFLEFSILFYSIFVELNVGRCDQGQCYGDVGGAIPPRTESHEFALQI